MRTDSQNLLDRLDQSDFRYQDFQSAEDARRGYGWPLLDIVGRAVGGRRRPVTPPPAAPIAAAEPAPAPTHIEPAPPARSFFSRYGEGKAAPVAEANRQPGDL